MAAEKQKPETQFRVILLVPGSKVETAAKTLGGVAVEKVEKIEPFVPGEWKRLNYGDPGTGRWDDDYLGKPMDKWVNTDGRVIDKMQRLAPGQGKKPFGEKRLIDAYATRDEYGVVDVVDTLDDAKKLLRPVSTREEMLEKADLIAVQVAKGESYDSEHQETAEEYLAMRRITVPKEPERDKDERRKPQYDVTLTIEGSAKDTVLRIAKSAFGNKLKTVELVQYGFSRAADLERAESLVKNAAEIVGELKQDMEQWKENLPENFQGGQKEEELDQAASNLEDIENALAGIDWNVEFPGMF